MAGGGVADAEVVNSAAADAGAVTAGDEGIPSRPEDGAVLTVLNKRLRALKKKSNRISQIEEAKASGKEINKEQEDVLRSKPSVMLLIEEYEKLRAPLQTAVKEELADAENKLLNQVLQQRAAAAAAAEAEAQAQAQAKNDEANGNADGLTSESEVDNLDGRKAEASGSTGDFSKLVELLYFGALFDTKAIDSSGLGGSGPEVMRWRREQERNSCLSYDAASDNEASPQLSQEDLDAVSALSRLFSTRSQSARNHKEAVEQCLQHAIKWLSGADEVVDETLPVSYAVVKERLQRIISSDYFTTGVLDVNPEVAAAAAATGQYVSEPMPEGHLAEETGQAFAAAEQQQAHYAPQDQADAPQYYAPPQYADYGVPGQDRGLPEGAAQHMLVSPIASFVPQGGFTVMDPSQQQVHPQYSAQDQDASQPDQAQQQQQPQPQHPEVQPGVEQSYLPNGIQYPDQQSLGALQQQQQQQQQQAAQVNPQVQQQQQAPAPPGVFPGGPVPYGGASRGPMGGRLQGSGGGGRGYGGRGRGRGAPRGGRAPHFDQPGGGGYGQGGYRGGRGGGRGPRGGGPRGGGHPQWAGPPPNGAAAPPATAG